jgi:DNA modification methylase
LRVYGDATKVTWPDGWFGQLGLERDFHLYIDHLMTVFTEVKRVLKPTGSIYINIGDTYSASLGPHKGETAGFSKVKMVTDVDKPEIPKSVPRKSLCMIPERFAVRMVDEGWMPCRNKIVWQKRNHMPSSVKDKLSPSWEPIYAFTKGLVPRLWRIMRDLKAEHGLAYGTWLTERPNFPYREWLLKKDWNGYKAGEWVGEKRPPPKFRVPPSQGGTRPNWQGFTCYYELDAIREPHKSLKGSGNKERKYIERMVGPNLGSSIPPGARFNIRVRDAKEGRRKGYAGNMTPALDHEIAGYDERAYSGKYASGKIDPETVNSPRARLTRDVSDKTLKDEATARRLGIPHPGKSTAGLYDPQHTFYHFLGGNPGDVFKDDTPELVPGRAPDDVVSDVGNPDGFPLNPPHTSYGSRRHLTGSMYPAEQPGHPEGKNPGDIVDVSPETRTMGAIIGERGVVKVPGGEGWTGHPEGGMARIVRENDPRWLMPLGKNPGDFWDVTTRKAYGGDAHYAVFPEGLCKRPILSSCPPDGTVMDIFAGTGTVGAVAKKYGRHFILLELNPDYCDLARRRLSSIPSRLENWG